MARSKISNYSNCIKKLEEKLTRLDFHFRKTQLSSMGDRWKRVSDLNSPLSPMHPCMARADMRMTHPNLGVYLDGTGRVLCLFPRHGKRKKREQCQCTPLYYCQTEFRRPSASAPVTKTSREGINNKVEKGREINGPFVVRLKMRCRKKGTFSAFVRKGNCCVIASIPIDEGSVYRTKVQ